VQHGGCGKDSDSMKILFVNQFFWPDVAATGQFLTDLVRQLGRDHEITVICSAGSYAETEAGQSAPPARIVRVPGLSYQRGTLARALSYSTFFLGALWYELRCPRQDLIVTMTTPPLLAIGGRILKALRGTRHYIWEMDLFPDALVSLGALSERGWITRVLGWLEDSCRRRSDGIIALGPCMRRRLVSRGIPRNLVRVAENWADGGTISPGPYRRSEPLNVLYSGNLGLSHDVDTIACAMRHFRNDPRFVFTFAGGGVGRSRLEAICSTEGIGNARFLPYASRDRMGEHLGQADIGLVTERAICIGTVVPSKVYGLMAAGRPILFIGPRRATPSLLIRRFQCGWHVEAGDSGPLIALLESLSANRETIWRHGRRARAAFDRYYDLPHGVNRVAAALGLETPPHVSGVEQPGQRSDAPVTLMTGSR